ncbi:MAG: hypothetical protein QM660_10290 [Dysgonomonas sp.]
MGKYLMLVGILSYFLLFSACKDDDSDSSVWNDNFYTIKVGDISYIYPSSVIGNSAYGTKAGDLELYSSVSDFGQDYGIYSNCRFAIEHTLQGEGEYTITDLANYKYAVETGGKYLYIHINLGKDYRYNMAKYTTSKDSGKAQVTIIDGKYHFTISEPVTIKREDITGDMPKHTIEEIEVTLTNGHYRKK